MTIHPEHPFLGPSEDRDPARRLRARLVSPVTIWAASAAATDGRPVRAGFTVGSTTVVDGDPACLLGVVDPEADLWTVVEGVGRFAVTLLHWTDRHLADVFAGLAPAPGGGFAVGPWLDTSYGPVLGGRTWAGCRLVDSRTLGYGRLITGAVEEVALDPSTDQSADVLARLRGRYTAVPPPRR